MKNYRILEVSYLKHHGSSFAQNVCSTGTEYDILAQIANKDYKMAMQVGNQAEAEHTVVLVYNQICPPQNGVPVL